MPELVTGYLPARIRCIEELVAGFAPVDVLRVGPDLTVAQCRELVDHLNRAPLAASSPGRAIVVNLDHVRPAEAAALLKLVEEPPAGAQIVLTATEPWQVATTLRSRCHLHEFMVPAYGAVLADLRGRGLAMAAATRLAQAVQAGTSVEQAPRDTDTSLAKALRAAGRDSRGGDVAEMLHTVTPVVVAELRRLASDERRYADVVNSYRQADAPSQALALIGMGVQR